LGLIVPVAVPSFPGRRLQGIGAPEWETRLRLAGPQFPSAHAIPGFEGRQAEGLFHEPPEFFSLLDGQRKVQQVCVSSPRIPMKTHTAKMNMAIFLTVVLVLSLCAGASPGAVRPEQPVKLFPLEDVRLRESLFSEAVKVNRQYLLAHDPDRLLAPFRREAGLKPKAQPYGNWESGGLDGHTAGHYLSALSLMMASGADPNGGFRRRLAYMIDELADIQKANGNGYLGGVPGSKDFWRRIAEGNVELMRNKWVPWYNLHKMYAGLRDAYLHGGNEASRDLLVRFGDWCEKVTSGLTDAQMQRMIDTEYGGMNEVRADIYAISGDRKYIELAQRFNHRAVFEPLENRQDRLTGLHANTPIPVLQAMATPTADCLSGSPVPRRHRSGRARRLCLH